MNNRVSCSTSDSINSFKTSFFKNVSINIFSVFEKKLNSGLDVSISLCFTDLEAVNVADHLITGCFKEYELGVWTGKLHLSGSSKF